jgi:hypothetical protein
VTKRLKQTEWETRRKEERRGKREIKIIKEGDKGRR